MTRRIDKRNRADRFGISPAAGALRKCGKPFRSRTFRTFIKDSVCISEPDGDSPFHLLTMPVGPDTRKSIDERRLPMINMADNADICARYYIFRHQLSNLLTYLNTLILIREHEKSPVFRGFSPPGGPENRGVILHRYRHYPGWVSR